jgi:hypothetical protein
MVRGTMVWEISMWQTKQTKYIISWGRSMLQEELVVMRVLLQFGWWW